MKKYILILFAILLAIHQINVNADVSTSGLIISNKLASINATNSVSFNSVSISDGGTIFKATSNAEAKNYTFYRSTSSIPYYVSLTGLSINNINFTINNGISNSMLNLTGSTIHNLYLNGILSNSNWHVSNGVNVITISSARTVEVDFTGTPYISLIDSVSITDSVSRVRNVSLNESMSMSDNISKSASLHISLSEGDNPLTFDYSSNTGWIHHQGLALPNFITINDPSFPNVLKFNGVGGAGGDTTLYEWQQYDLGLLPDSFTVNFDYQWQSSSLSGGTPILLITDGTGSHPDLATSSFFIFHGLLDISPFHGNGFELNRDTSAGTIDLGAYANQTVYVTVNVVQSTNTVTLKVFSDSSRTIQIGSTLTSTSNTLSNLRYLYHANNHSGGSSRVLTAEIDNLSIPEIKIHMFSDSLASSTGRLTNLSDSLSLSENIITSSSFVRVLSDTLQNSDVLVTNSAHLFSVTFSDGINHIEQLFLIDPQYSAVQTGIGGVDAIIQKLLTPPQPQLFDVTVDKSQVNGTFGQLVSNYMPLSWSSEADITISKIDAGEFANWISFPKTPFTIKGNALGSSVASVQSKSTLPYNLIIPSKKCDIIQTSFDCVVPDSTYQIPITFESTINGSTYTVQSTVSVNVAKQVMPDQVALPIVGLLTFVLMVTVIIAILLGLLIVKVKKNKNRKSKHSKNKDDDELGNSKTAKKLKELSKQRSELSMSKESENKIKTTLDMSKVDKKKREL